MELQIIPDARAGRQKGVVRFTPQQRSARWRARNPQEVKDYAAGYRLANPRFGSQVSAKEQRRWYANQSPIVRLLRNAMRRAEERGLEFDLEPSDFLTLPTDCPVLGLKLIYGATIGAHPRRRDRDAFASLDRKDNSKGYVRGNVFIVSWRANQLKSNATPQEIAALSKWMGG